MKLILLFLLSFLFSCSSVQKISSLSSSKRLYIWKDKSGEFVLERDVRVSKKKLATRSTLSLLSNRTKVLEKTVGVSQIGLVKIRGNTIASLRPFASQHSIWFDKKEYFSQLKVNAKKKALDVKLSSPEEKWKGAKEFKFPKGFIFCFFSQIPECVKRHGLLKMDNRGKQIYIIWDSYPYHTEQLEGVLDQPFQSANFAFNTVIRGEKRYSLNLENQILFYHFNNRDEFEKMYWIAQGITVKRYEEEY